mgnify:FL=1|jgi:hypothetical protein|tara:strand:- start:411 stop:674 length:264 start_codon:yes stop_codon:yes gene_type:complete
MAIKLNDKWYDESKFSTEMKNAIIQVSNYQKQVNNLNVDLQNARIIVAHHAKYIQDNVPASAEVEEPKAKAEPKVETEDDYGNPTTE